MRYVLGLEPLGEEARKAHDGVVKHVLRSGTKISLLVRSHKPSERCYTIERSVPNPPVLKDESGGVLTLKPKDVMPGVEVYGQHEISELTKSREKLTLLLERFVDRDPALASRKGTTKLELERSRSRLLDVQREIKAFDDRLAALPALEETLKRFQEAGLEEKLKKKSLLVREERLFTEVSERLDPLRTLQKDLRTTLPINTEFVSKNGLEGLPNIAVLGEIETILNHLSNNLKTVGEQLTKLLDETDSAIAGVKTHGEIKKRVSRKPMKKFYASFKSQK